MIKKTKEGFKVVAKSTGKSLSKSNLTKPQAVKRVAQVEYFKSKAGKK